MRDIGAIELKPRGRVLNPKWFARFRRPTREGDTKYLYWDK